MLRPERQEPFIDFRQIKRDAFILLNIGHGLQNLLADHENDVVSRKDSALFREYGGMYEGEISSRLIRVSVAARMLDDKLIHDGVGVTANKFAHEEEMLGDDEQGVPLSLRQCFNKVIHASSLDHELQLPEVLLTGKHQNKEEWHVRIFLLPFCTAVYQWVDQCQNSHLPSKPKT